MKRFEDRDERRPKKRSKKKRQAEPASWRLPLIIGGASAGVVVLALVVWGITRLFSPGGLYGPVVADARPADPEKKKRIDESPDAVPATFIPAGSDGWSVTPDAVPPASGLASAVVLPDGQPLAVLFADPARAKAAVLLAKVVVQPKEGFPLAVLEKSVNIQRFPDGSVLIGAAPKIKANVSLSWAQVDLKAGAVVAQTPLGTYELVSGQGGGFPNPLATTTLSPSGDRLAAIVPQNKEALQVWDSSGKVVRSWDDPLVFAGRWLAFVTEDRLLAHGKDKVAALDVASGQVAHTFAEASTPPFGLSPGRKWLATMDPAGSLKVFHTADGTVACSKTKPLAKGTPATLTFHPDGATLAATPLRWALWLTPRHLVLEETFFDLDGNVALWKYPPQPGSLVARTSPDGRLWSVGAFNNLDPNRDPRKFKAGPLADAAKQGKFLLAAFTAPHGEVRTRLERGRRGIEFRRGDPLRVEVVGSGSVESQKQAAEAAAAALAKQGLAVDPEAKVGVRIELSSPRNVTVVSRIPNAPPGMNVNTKSGRPGFAISYKVLFFNRENGVVSPPFTTHEVQGFADDEGRLDRLYRNVGDAAAPPGGILTGMWDREGQIQMLGSTTLGIDGVLEP
jgi:hypothetical protein